MFRGKTWIIRQKSASIAACVLLVLALFFLARPETSDPPVLSYGVANRVIVIDPGHGGIDTEASRGSAVEKEITLRIGQRLARYLSQAGAAVILLRNNESDLAGDGFAGSIRERKRTDMAKRVKRANDAGADLYVSIHTNAETGTTWSGAQTFYQPGDAKSKLLAASIQQELCTILGNTKRKAAAGNYYILKNTKMPAVIVEVGFISNPTEARLLQDSSYQSKVAYAIFSGIACSELAGQPPATGKEAGKP